MTSSMSVGSKITILIVLAIVFGATMVGLSLRKHEPAEENSRYRGDARNIDKTFSVKPGDKLVVDVFQGDISVTGTDAEEMVVHVIIRGSESLTKKYSVEMDQNGSIVSIRALHDKSMFHWFDGNSLDVKYEIHVPRKFNMKLETAGGNIDLAGIEGELEGETSGGDLRVEDVRGTINISTSGGNVKVNRSAGVLTLGTSGGDIYGDELSGSIRVETSGGNINIRESQGAMRASTSGGDIRVEMKDNKGIDLSTSGGSVSLSLPGNVAGEIDAETSGGDVSCDFAFTGKMREGSLHGTINGGGERIRLESSGGDIVVHAVE